MGRWLGELGAVVVMSYMCASEILGRAVFFQAEDGIRNLVRSRGLGDVYKRQLVYRSHGE